MIIINLYIILYLHCSISYSLLYTTVIKHSRSNTHRIEGYIMMADDDSTKIDGLEWTYCGECSSHCKEFCSDCVKVWHPNYLGSDSGNEPLHLSLLQIPGVLL